MADKLGLGGEVRELKIGQSFTNSKSTAFHTIRYDFKPASVDINKIATVDVGGNHQVTVTVPHLDGAGVPQTVFKGSQRPYQKECVLIIDRVTGEITLEKLSSNIQVKKTRNEAAKLPLLQADRSAGQSSSDRNQRPQTPPIGQRMSSKTRVTSGSRRPDRPITHLVPKHSPLHASPSYPSPGHHRSPKRDHLSNESHSQSTLASLPLIGDDFSEPAPNAVVPEKSPNDAAAALDNGIVGEITDTSSSSSDSENDSDSALDRTVVPRGQQQNSNNNNSNVNTNSGKANGHSTNGVPQKQLPSMPAHILNEDLCLSESGSDSE